MKVIYTTCYADPWIKVAKKLRDDYGYEPVYWNGYEDDDSEKIIQKYFPDAIYHPYYDAWKGNFPPVIDHRFSESYIDIDFLKENAEFELQAIKMMDRMDADRHSFNFMERQRHFRNFLKYWTGCINHFQPEVVISAAVPHRVYDYALYLLCKFRSIDFIAFQGTPFTYYSLPVIKLSTIGEIFDVEYSGTLKSDRSVDEIRQQVSPDIYSYYENIKKNYTEGRPSYVPQEEIKDKKYRGVIGLFKKLIFDMTGPDKKRYLGRNGYLMKGIPTYQKEKNKNIENSHHSLVRYALLKVKTNKYKKKLKRYYNSRVVEPKLNELYVILNLHYQPEATTSPSGDVFVDQMLCVEMLLKHLPDNYLIYVKEHPAQFQSHREGHTYRFWEFYSDFLRSSRVRLMPLQYDPYILIKNAKAVASVAGTAGWEAMALGKPVICFGMVWYEKYDGVLKIVDESSASRINEFIENFRFDERNLMAYLAAFSKKAVKAYYYRGLKQIMNQPEEECVCNIANAIIHATKHSSK
ncbi:MAG: hypothetical protein KKD31_19685 [Bacteroidetes bacterium]|nr:hypothetical protein [Bacteroidota bacterium]